MSRLFICHIYILEFNELKVRRLSLEVSRERCIHSRFLQAAHLKICHRRERRKVVVHSAVMHICECVCVCAIEVSVPSKSAGIWYIGWVAMGESLFICVTHLCAARLWQSWLQSLSVAESHSISLLMHPSAARKVTHTPSKMHACVHDQSQKF